MKFRIWWLPQVGVGIKSFYKEVSSFDEGQLICDILADYDLYQLNNSIKPDYCNAGGIQYFDENDQDWYDIENKEELEFLNI